MGVTVFVTTCLIIDLNNFFMKFVLWVPAEHDLLKCRVALWGLSCIAVSREWYEFISNPYCHRLGAFAWLAFYNAGIEVLITYRFQEGNFTEPFPWYVKVIWFFVLVGFSLLFSIAWRNQQKEDAKSKDSSGYVYNPYNPDLEITDHRTGKTKLA